jgi:hypothetical protein
MPTPTGDQHLDPRPIDRIILVICGLTALATVSWAAAAAPLALPTRITTLIIGVAVAVTIVTALLAVDYVRFRRTNRAVMCIEAAARASQNELTAATAALACEVQSTNARLTLLTREIAGARRQTDDLTRSVTLLRRDTAAPRTTTPRRDRSRRNAAPQQTSGPQRNDGAHARGDKTDAEWRAYMAGVYDRPVED